MHAWSLIHVHLDSSLLTLTPLLIWVLVFFKRIHESSICALFFRTYMGYIWIINKLARVFPYKGGEPVELLTMRPEILGYYFTPKAMSPI